MHWKSYPLGLWLGFYSQIPADKISKSKKTCSFLYREYIMKIGQCFLNSLHVQEGLSNFHSMLTILCVQEVLHILIQQLARCKSHTCKWTYSIKIDKCYKMP